MLYYFIISFFFLLVIYFLLIDKGTIYCKIIHKFKIDKRKGFYCKATKCKYYQICDLSKDSKKWTIYFYENLAIRTVWRRIGVFILTNERITYG